LGYIPIQLHATDSIGWKPVAFIEDTNQFLSVQIIVLVLPLTKSCHADHVKSLPQSLKFSDFIGRATEASKFTQLGLS